MSSQECFHKLTTDEAGTQGILFCFAPAGASAFSLYYDWKSLFEPSLQLFAAELPGRGYRISDPPHTQFQDLIEELYDALKKVLTNESYMFIGHSFGALISYELTKKIHMEAELQGPKHLFLAGANPPHIPSTTKRFITLDDASLVVTLKELGGVEPHTADSEAFQEVFLPIIRSDFMLSSSYLRENLIRLSCPITVLTGNQDKLILKQHMKEWDRYSSELVQYRIFEGDHFFIQQYKGHIANIIKETLI